MTEDEDLKKARHDSLETVFVDRQRYDAIAVGKLFSSAPPPPLPLSSSMPQFGEAPDSRS